MSAGNNAFRRKLERGAELRAVRGWGGNAQEDAELEAADAEEREKRRKVDDAARVEYLIRDAMNQGKFDNLKYSRQTDPRARRALRSRLVGQGTHPARTAERDRPSCHPAAH